MNTVKVTLQDFNYIFIPNDFQKTCLNKKYFRINIYVI